MRLCPHCGTRKSVSLPATQRWGDTSMAQHWKKAGNKENDVDHEKQPGRPSSGKGRFDRSADHVLVRAL